MLKVAALATGPMNRASQPEGGLGIVATTGGRNGRNGWPCREGRSIMNQIIDAHVSGPIVPILSSNKSSQIAKVPDALL
jgi:hypothetical protein